MKSLTNLIGILLVIFGTAALGYQGFTYTSKEKIAQIGEVQITADKEKTVLFPPLLSGIAIVAGIVLVWTSRRS